jgi:hypothetical protein
VISCVSAMCNLWVTFTTCYQTLNQFMLYVNNWKIVKIMTKQYYHSCKESKVRYFPYKKNSIIIKSNMEGKI